MKRQRALQWLSRFFQGRPPVERRMVIDALLAIGLSMYLISPLPNMVIAMTSPVVSMLLVIILPVLAVIYLYRRLKFYASLFAKKKAESEAIRKPEAK